MRCYLTGWVILTMSILLFPQTIISVEAGPISYTDLDGSVDDSYNVDISDCTSIQFALDYNFSLAWVGSGNMELSDDCGGGACAGDPNDPVSGACDGCWDFMWVEFDLGGSNVEDELIGESGTTDSEQSGIITSDIFCTDGATDAEIRIRNQNWASDETNTFSNVVIYCWEGYPTFTTNDPVCSNQNMDLSGSAGDETVISDWDWKSDAGAIINDPVAQNTFATDITDGETFTLTTTDVNTCSASYAKSVTTSNFTAELTGGGDVCPGDCTDPSTDITVSINGGVAPYQVVLNVDGFPITVPGIDIDEQFRICIDPDIAIPTVDPSASPFQITVSTGFDISIINIVDATSCIGTINGGAVTINALPEPFAMGTVNPLDVCFDGGTGLLDLTQFDDLVTGGDNSLDVSYYLSEDASTEIVPADEFPIITNNVYARTFDGTCYSDFVLVAFNPDSKPSIDNVQPIEECIDNDNYILPFPSAIADIAPAEVSVLSAIQYYLDPDGNDGPYTSIPINTTEVYMIWTPGSNSTCDPVVALVEVDLNRIPILDDPTGTLSGCGKIELPLPDGDFFNDHLYEDNNGIFYTAGDEILESDNVTSVTLTLIGDNGCNYDEVLNVDITEGVSYTVPNLSPACDSIILPPITPSSPTASYFTSARGNGTEYEPGDKIFAPFDETLFLYDPNASCTQEVSFDLEIIASPKFELPRDTSSCEELELPPFRGTFSSDAFYSTEVSNDDDKKLFPGDILADDDRIFILDTLGGCPTVDTMDVTIVTEPYAGIDNSVEICEGYTGSTLDLVDLIGDPDNGGDWSYPSIPDFNPTDPTDVDVSTLPEGDHDITYAIDREGCPIALATLTINVVAPPDAGDDNQISQCIGGIFDFENLISNPESGGQWSQTDGDVVDLSDPINVDMTASPSGDYEFEYTLSGNAASGLCDDQTTTLSITLLPEPNAGDDNFTTVCEGETINIRDLLSNDAETTGMFEPDGFLLTGDTWNTTDVAPQTYLVQYIVENRDPQCDSDMAELTIEVLGNSEFTIEEELCAGTSMEVNGTTYDEDNPSGSEILTAANGCDSTVLVNLTFLDAIEEDVNDQLCAGASMDINGTTYDESNPTGTEIIQTASGCDSTINVNLTFLDAIEEDVNDQLCAGASMDINGTTYDESNPTGTEVIQTASGCDSTINVNLSFLPLLESEVNEELCTGAFIEVNGRTYDESNPAGTEVIQTASGCDSTVTVNLTFSPPIQFTLDDELCDGGSVEVNGTVYDENNSTGTEILQTINGCDSTVIINLSFADALVRDINQELCSGATIEVNGTVFDENNPSGSEVITTASGCDSTVNVSLTFISEVTFDLNEQLCSGSTIDVNGTTYDESNPSGTEMLVSSAGCDSIVNVNLTFAQSVSFDLTQQLCTGATIEVNGTTYDESNPTGTETFTTANGCDSLVNIILTFQSDVESDYEETICDGSERIIEGELFDVNNPSGQVLIPNGSTAGCDSLVNVMLDYQTSPTTNLTPSLCTGETVVVNGNIYGENNSSGLEVLEAANGCDSLVVIDLTFAAAKEENIDQQLCTGSSIEVNGTIYDESNPNGTEMLTTANGCDSLVNVNLTFAAAIVEDLNQEICTGTSIEVNGTIYDESNPTGTETFMTASGCDSLVNVSLTFAAAIVEDLNQEICTGTSIEVNGTIYDETNPTGTETFMTASGCDSLVNVSLTFAAAIVEDLNREICTGTFIEVNGTIYDETNPTGTETFMTASGCDSLVNVNLTFAAAIEESLDQELCSGGSIEINGTIYDETNPTGTEMFVTSAGCDSLLTVNLTFQDAPQSEITQELCVGGSIEINGTTYDESNSNGVETYTTSDGCDSLVIVTLTFSQAIEGNLDVDLCQGESFTYDGVVYDESNPAGTAMLTSVNGCDSLLNINLNFVSQVNVERNETLCSGQSIEVNGIIYDEANPSGMETISSASGCDSLVMINLSFAPASIGNVEETLCSGGTITVNGVVYDESNPVGSELLTSSTGCDSIVNISLTFQNEINVTIDDMLCGDEAIEVNGITYDQSNPTGAEILQSVNGCDSIVTIDLSFGQGGIENIEQTLCEGQSIEVNGTVYDESNPTGTETIITITGCDSTINVNLSYVSSFVENLDQSLCEGGSIEVNGVVYDESNPSGIESMKSVNGCDSIVNINLTFVAPTVTFEVEDACSNGMEGNVSIVAVDGFTLPVMLDVDGTGPVEVNNLPFEFVLLTGAHDISVNDANCLYQESITVENGSEPTAEIIPTDDGQGNLSFVLQSDITPTNLTWSSSELALSCESCETTSAANVEGYTLTASFEDDNGCLFTRTITGTAPPQGEVEVYIPNTFDQSDPENASFYVQSENDFMVDQMLIFDRWGNVIFNNENFFTNDPDQGWNATRNGKRIEQGVYVYAIQMTFDDRPRYYRGTLTVVK